MSTLRSRPALLALALVVQLGLVGVAVDGQLSARLTGEEYTLRVLPIDPIDPFRGAYVDLGYPDLAGAGADGILTTDDIRRSREDGDRVFVPLVRDGDVWVGRQATRVRPDDGPYLRCTERSWRVRCGIESWFLPQDEALALEEKLAQGDVLATIRVDSRGNAALVDVG